MAGFLPATGTQIAMGRVFRAYTDVIPTVGYTIRLSGTLGAFFGSLPAGVQISFSSQFGGRYYPYTY